MGELCDILFAAVLCELLQQLKESKAALGDFSQEYQFSIDLLHQSIDSSAKKYFCLINE